MKNTVRKITTVLLVLMLAAGLITSALADTVYVTQEFVIPTGRIGGAKLDAQQPEETEGTPPDAIPDDGTEEKVETQEIPEALDENAEGLIVVDGEEKTEDINIWEQTEVRTNEAQDNLEEKTGSVIVRDAPDGMGNIIMTMSPDEPVNIIGVEDHWYKVDVDGIIGYIFGADYDGGDEYQTDFTGISINLFSNRRSGMHDGEPLILTCEVLDYTMEYPLYYEWFVDRHDGLGMQQVEGSTSTYEIPVSKETLSYDWYVEVYAETPD